MKTRLFTPGPTPVPEKIALKMAEPIIHHRSPEFGKLFTEVNEDLKYLFQTENEVLTFTSSGTGAMEAAVVNLLSRGDNVLGVRGGKFGERWGQLCEAYGVNFEPLDIEWGYAVDPEAIGERLNANPDIKAVFITQNETSTGVLTDVEAIGKLTDERDVLLIVDAVSSLGAIPLYTDDWGVDVTVAGSQKGLMLPPGLAFASVSDRAWKAADSSDLPKYYFSFKKTMEALKKNQNPFTPAVSLMVGLGESLKSIKEQGLENLWAKHARHAEATRRAAKAMGLNIFAKNPSDVLTIVGLPEDVDGKKLVKLLSDDYGVTFAGGQEKLSGKVIRISHLGYVDDLDVISAISALEMVLKKLRWDFQPGSGISAAEESLLEG